MTFREAHHLVARTVAACGSGDDASTIATTILSLQPSLHLTREEIERVLDPDHFVRIRKVKGGPAPETTAVALSRARAEQDAIETWVAAKTSMLDRACAELRQRSSPLPNPAA